MNSMYQRTVQAFMRAEINWLTDSVRTVLLTEDYEPDFELDEFLSDIPKSAIVAVSQPLTNKTFKAEGATAASVTFQELRGKTVKSMVLFKEDGNQSRLLLYIDQAKKFLPYVPNGADYRIIWDEVIFTL
jgi:hypothetical protein